ncbi:MAG TPA: DUF167 domain-containing protein [Aquabacterium sp.]|nr:DUF167 domain-containing protein [Aquabacterium sp.]HQC96252.1 DUF167 domain-containing protein [Aquabacterium sp.]
MAVTGPGWPCLRAADDGCVLDLSVQPNAKKTQPDGLHDGALRVRLAAPPVDGKANAALLAWLAAELRCPKRDLSLLRGEASRRKQVQVALPEQAVATWLDRVLCP